MDSTIPAEIEATDATFRVEFEGHTYDLLAGAPSPKAMTYLADFVDQENGLYLVLYCREVLGRDGWDAWCGNHPTEQIQPFVAVIGKALSSRGN